MTNKVVRHVLGISGGKDSAALALYLDRNFPELPIEYYFCDTGKELPETYELIENLKTELRNKHIEVLEAADKSHVDPFDHYLEMYRGFLPSSNARWCTKQLKLDPFEKFVGDGPVISYVGIRDDEDREGYISKKSNIQSIFPFRKNIWSEDVILLILKNAMIDRLADEYRMLPDTEKLTSVLEIVNRPLSLVYQQHEKHRALLNMGIAEFNRVVFNVLKESKYPLSLETDFSLLKKEEGLNREDIFEILRNSHVGIPKYYKEVEFQVNGKTGTYARSRSGCYFCFFQQRIEWIWLYEQHPEMFQKALQYEKNGYTWMEKETLAEIILPARMQQIKEDHIKKTLRKGSDKNSPYLIDILEEAEGEGCAACFI